MDGRLGFLGMQIPRIVPAMSKLDNFKYTGKESIRSIHDNAGLDDVEEEEADGMINGSESGCCCCFILTTALCLRDAWMYIVDWCLGRMYSFYFVFRFVFSHSAFCSLLFWIFFSYGSSYLLAIQVKTL